MEVAQTFNRGYTATEAAHAVADRGQGTGDVSSQREGDRPSHSSLAFCSDPCFVGDLWTGATQQCRGASITSQLRTLRHVRTWLLGWNLNLAYLTPELGEAEWKRVLQEVKKCNGNPPDPSMSVINEQEAQTGEPSRLSCCARHLDLALLSTRADKLATPSHSSALPPLQPALDPTEAHVTQGTAGTVQTWAGGGCQGLFQLCRAPPRTPPSESPWQGKELLGSLLPSSRLLPAMFHKGQGLSPGLWATSAQCPLHHVWLSAVTVKFLILQHGSSLEDWLVAPKVYSFICGDTKTMVKGNTVRIQT
nr:uncharacterized protein LOC106027903 [Cavia porcellus]